MQQSENSKCMFCRDTRCLTLSGIVKVFLLPRLIFLILTLLTICAAYFFTPFLYLAALVIFLLPLALADLRLYLFLPVVLLAILSGKKVNCPKCNPSGTLFRKDTADMESTDRFME